MNRNRNILLIFTPTINNKTESQYNYDVNDDFTLMSDQHTMSNTLKSTMNMGNYDAITIIKRNDTYAWAPPLPQNFVLW